MTQTSRRSDPVGRIKNISPAPSATNTLQPMFEALMNSIHAVEERIGWEGISSGVIDIKMTENGERSYTGFVVNDYGIGLDPDNMTSFRKSHNMKKAKLGGKGGERLLWLKVADKISVDNRYPTGQGVWRVAFDSAGDPHEPNSNFSEAPDEGDVGTTVNPPQSNPEFVRHIPIKRNAFVARSVGYFFNRFVNIDCPRIVLSDSKDSVVPSNKFTELMAWSRDCIIWKLQSMLEYVCYLPNDSPRQVLARRRNLEFTSQIPRPILQ